MITAETRHFFEILNLECSVEIPVIQCNYLAEHRKSETIQLFDFVIQPCKDLRERELAADADAAAEKGRKEAECGGKFRPG